MKPSLIPLQITGCTTARICYTLIKSWGTLIIWDRLFGSFQEEKFRPKYGLTKNVSTYNPVKVTFHEWMNIAKDLKKSKGIKDVCNYLFNAPEWTHDGSNKTTKQLRKEAQVK